jgi:hypothetical protein
MKTSNIIAIILLLTVSILPTFVSAEALFIDTPFQEIEFDQNRPLPKVWTVCYPSCDEENKLSKLLARVDFGQILSLGKVYQ